MQIEVCNTFPCMYIDPGLRPFLVGPFLAKPRPDPPQRLVFDGAAPRHPSLQPQARKGFKQLCTGPRAEMAGIKESASSKDAFFLLRKWLSSLPSYTVFPPQCKREAMLLPHSPIEWLPGCMRTLLAGSVRNDRKTISLDAAKERKFDTTASLLEA